jgi:hypothetical protein
MIGVVLRQPAILGTAMTIDTIERAEPEPLQLASRPSGLYTWHVEPTPVAPRSTALSL